MNNLNVISPYLWNGQWVFDDPTKGLVREPFVEGADTIIDMMVAGIPDAWRGFNLIFSSGSFPNYDLVLDWESEEYGGNWYRTRGMRGWLCPSLLKYFDSVPKVIYVKFNKFNREAE